MSNMRPFGDAGVMETPAPDAGTADGQSQTGTAPAPLLLTASQAAAMVGATERTWRTWHAMGSIPQPIRIGRKTFWRSEDIKAWVAAGCPDRATWEILQR